MANVDQTFASTDLHGDGQQMTISAPQEWDGIGQALRGAYHDHRDFPVEFADVLGRLDACD